MSEALTRLGQIQDGYTVTTTFKGEKEVWRNVKVLKPNTDMEEILLDKKENLYFITSMALDGSSWAQDVQVQPNKQQDKPTDESEDVKEKLCTTGKLLAEVFFEGRPEEKFWVEQSISDMRKLTNPFLD